MIEITESKGTDDFCEHATYEITIKKDGEVILYESGGPLNECPKYAILERDLGYIYSIKEAFMLGYEAGLANEKVRINDPD